MSGRFVWLDEDTIAKLERVYELQPPIIVGEILAAWRRADADPLLAFIEATRDRRAFGDAEWQVETIAVGLRALGMPPRD